MSSRHLIEIPWIVFLLYWVCSALKTRRTVVRESFSSRYGVMLLEVIGFVLLFNDAADNIGFLGQHIFVRSTSSYVIALVIVWSGIALAIWARWHLGQYWSGRITLKEGHKLIRTGPYAHFRHPIYSGLDLAAIGTALAIDRWRCLLGLCFIITGYWIKARREESLLASQFGEEFTEHSRQTGFLIPKF